MNCLTTLIMPISPLGELFDVFKDSFFACICFVHGSPLALIIGIAAVVVLLGSMAFMRSVFADSLAYSFFPVMKAKAPESFKLNPLLKLMVEATTDEKLCVLLTEDVWL